MKGTNNFCIRRETGKNDSKNTIQKITIFIGSSTAVEYHHPKKLSAQASFSSFKEMNTKIYVLSQICTSLSNVSLKKFSTYYVPSST